MITKNFKWRKTLKKKIDPTTLVKFDPEKCSQDCYTCTDVRISCDGCRKLECNMIDLYEDKDYDKEWIPLCEFDLRLHYHRHTNDSKEGETTKDEYGDDKIFKLKGWYLMKEKNMELIYKLRNLEKFIVDNGIDRSQPKYRITYEENKVKKSSIESPWFNSSYRPLDDDIEQLIDYYGPDTGIISDVSKWKNHDYNYIDDKDICLCSSCYMWLNFILPGIDKNFKLVSSGYLCYSQWLDEHEDALMICKDNDDKNES